MLDPGNPRKAQGGFGENSELLMPGYGSPPILWTSERRPLDTLSLGSSCLHRTYPTYVYTPPGASPEKGLPTIYVTDGGEYLSLAGMDRILDRLILSKSNSGEAWHNRGIAFCELKRLHEAVESLSKAIALAPESAQS